MAYNVRIMEKAEEDLSGIVDYISDTLKNQKAADNLLVDFLHEKGAVAGNRPSGLTEPLGRGMGRRWWEFKAGSHSRVGCHN